MKPHTKGPTDVSVRELKNRLSEYLRRVQAGEEVHVTLRGRRIALLLPERASAGQTAAEIVARLDGMPWLQPQKQDGRPRGADRPLPARVNSEELLRWLRG